MPQTCQDEWGLPPIQVRHSEGEPWQRRRRLSAPSRTSLTTCIGCESGPTSRLGATDFANTCTPSPTASPGTPPRRAPGSTGQPGPSNGRVGALWLCEVDGTWAALFDTSG